MATEIDPRDIVSGAAWDAISQRVAAMRELVWNDDSIDDGTRARGLQYLLRFLAAGIAVCMEHDDTVTPELVHMIGHRMSWGLDNPDCVYSYTRIDGAGSYRIVGQAGTARHVELQVNTGHQSDGDFAGWRAVSALSGDDIEVGSDGSFEVTLSADPPARNGMRLDDTASFLLVRQYFCDWEEELPGRLVIERTDAPMPPPATTADRIAVSAGLLCDWLDTGARCWDGISRGILGGPMGDVQPFVPPAEASGLKGQAYGMGAWRCAPDEAVILELDPPACRMWGVSLCDRWWQSIEFAKRQSSLNSAQAAPDPDGTVRMVIAHDDPGIANWLDPGGNVEGTLAVRYLFAGGVPPVRVRAVAREQLDVELPEAERITPDERAERLRRRHAAIVRRSWC